MGILDAFKRGKPMDDDQLSIRWRERTRRYTNAVNEFVSKGLATGWDNAGAEPEDDRGELAEAVLQAVRRTNESGKLDGLRERFPPAHEPFAHMLNEKGQSIGPVALLDDGAVAARIGAPYEEGRVVLIRGSNIQTLPDAFTFGRSPDRSVFAFASDQGVLTKSGWDGPVIARFSYPSGQEGIPSGYGDVELINGTPVVEALVPFPDGRRVLLVGPDGVFILEQSKATRLLPTQDDYREHFSWLQKEYPGDPLSMNLDMVHGALSSDGRFVVTGAQDTAHLVFRDGELIGSVGNISDYPHHAAFSSDDSIVAANSCHFYNGETVGIPLAALEDGFNSEPYECEPPLFHLESGSRVYASAHRGDEFIFGDAYGYLRAVSNDGKPRWQHFIGSIVGSIDVSTDGSRLVVATYAGFICLLDLDTGEPDPFAIGTATHRETKRWVFWRGEKRPLSW